ncbi:MAG: ComEC family competence protein [Candidatus Campbellbacteria bacterium]|nr:ComEC family competence protein [Candidatus Campbellbacteria bacterium]
MPSIFVYAGVIGFLVGVAVRSVFEVPMIFEVCVGIVGVCVCVAGAARRGSTRAVLSCGICFVLFSAGLIRADVSFANDGNFLDAQLGQTIIEGIVVGEPSFTEKSQNVTLKVLHEKETARVSIITSPFPPFVYGDVLRVSGNLKKPESFVTDNGSTFNYPAYLAKDGIFQQMLFPIIDIISRGKGNFLYRALFSVRRRFVDTVATHLPEPNASLLSGISIGAKDGMDDATDEMFRRVGLIHIVVLSGYNITVVSDTVMRLLSFLPRAFMLGGGGVVVLLFTIMTGATATAVRAASMAVLALLARIVEAKYDIVRALFLVAFVMVLHNPRVLLFDPSFQLSFLATFGLITLSPIIEKKLARVTNTFSLRQTLSATLATQVFVVPLLVHMNGQVSFISLVANVVVLPVIPLSMFFTYLLGGIGPFVAPVATLLSFPTFVVSEYILEVSDFFSRVPFASVDVGLHPAILLVVYSVLLWWIWKQQHPPKRRVLGDNQNV